MAKCLHRIFEEYASKGSRQDDLLEELRNKLEGKAQEIEHPEQSFTNDEAEQWQETLDSLISKVEELYQENKVQQPELNNL